VGEFHVTPTVAYAAVAGAVSVKYGSVQEPTAAEKGVPVVVEIRVCEELYHEIVGVTLSVAVKGWTLILKV